MPAERAGVSTVFYVCKLKSILYKYTVTMFLIDTSPSMGKERTVELPDGPDGETKQVTMTNLEWSLQYVLMKTQEMVLYLLEKPTAPPAAH